MAPGEDFKVVVGDRTSPNEQWISFSGLEKPHDL
jgi:hypothetical protein